MSAWHAAFIRGTSGIEKTRTLVEEPENWESCLAMKAERIKQLNDGLLRRTGVDFSRYRNQELVDTVANAVTFPVFFARSVSRSVGAFLLAMCAVIIAVKSNFYEAFLAFVGFPLALVNGVLLGIVLFVRRIRDDMSRVFEISAQLTLQVMSDIGAARSKLSGQGKSFPSLLEIFQGVNAIVVLPVVTGILRRRLPLLGGLAARIIEKFFGQVDTRLVAAIEARNKGEITTPAPASPAEVSEWLQSAARLIESGRGLLSGIIDKVAKVVAFPFLTLFAVVFAISAAILLLAYALIV
jgi:hypothetical protein